MSDTSNPYKASDTVREPVSPQQSDGIATFNTRVLVGQAAPWLKFLGVLSYIGCGLILISGVVMIAVGGAGMFGSVPGLAMAGPILGFIYIALAVLVFFPSRYTYRMGSLGKQYKLDGNAAGLEGVALNLKKFVKYYGIITIVGLAIIPIMTIVTIVITASNLMSGR